VELDVRRHKRHARSINNGINEPGIRVQIPRNPIHAPSVSDTSHSSQSQGRKGGKGWKGRMGEP
jgi:hypothetical protein